MILQTLLLWINRTLDTFHVVHADEHPGENGQGLVEYALILALVSVVAMALLILFGPAVSNIFSNIMENIQNAAT